MSTNGKNSASDERDSPASIPRPTLPPLRALLAFEAAARHESFAQGAEELGVTPSAISHNIHQLEAYLGVVLFLRRAGRATLTDAGRIYARETARAFGIIAEATRLVAPQLQHGHLVIASGPSFAAKWLQPRLPQFLVAYPDVKVRLSTLSHRDDLATGRFDIAITYGRPSDTAAHIEPLFVERLRPLCSPKLAAELELHSPSDLAKATLIHSVNALTWADYLRQVGEVSLRPAHDMWLDRSTMAIEAAVASLGVVLESEILAAAELADARLIAPFGDSAFSVEVASYFLIRADGYRTGAHAAAFERWLRKAVLKWRTQSD